MKHTIATLLIFAAAVFAFGADNAQAASKPNVVFMMMDNLGWGEIGTYGGGELRGAATPRLDTLAEEGMKLLNFDGKTGNGHYADVIAEMDHRAGEILDAIDRLGIRDNTIVVWTSDNGPESAVGWHGTAGFWRGSYFTALEGSLRTSFLIRWPGKIKVDEIWQGIATQEGHAFF